MAVKPKAVPNKHATESGSRPGVPRRSRPLGTCFWARAKLGRGIVVPEGRMRNACFHHERSRGLEVQFVLFQSSVFNTEFLNPRLPMFWKSWIQTSRALCRVLDPSTPTAGIPTFPAPNQRFGKVQVFQAVGPCMFTHECSCCCCVVAHLKFI